MKSCQSNTYEWESELSTTYSIVMTEISVVDKSELTPKSAEIATLQVWGGISLWF